MINTDLFPNLSTRVISDIITERLMFVHNNAYDESVSPYLYTYGLQTISVLL